MTPSLPRLTFWRVFAVLAALVGLWATFLRFTGGIGAVSNLSDEVPWGLWISFDILCGVGLAAGGFTVTAIVYIFNLEKYRPIARPAVLTAFLGYSMVCVSLLFDLGRPWAIWHPLIYWNEHSVMFEVGWCVTLYTTVLALEFSPIVFERFGMNKAIQMVHKFQIPLVIAGIVLSTLHQSSLGSVFLIAPEKMHELWWTPRLPLLFYVSAAAVGLAMVIFESRLSGRLTGRELEMDILSQLGKGIAMLSGVYLALRFQDLASRGVMAKAFQPTIEAGMFWAEMALGWILPAALLLSRKVRESEQWLPFAATLSILGFVLLRLNCSITGFLPTVAANYFPSFLELGITVFLVVVEVAAFVVAIKLLPIFPKHGEEHGAAHEDNVVPMRPAVGARH